MENCLVTKLKSAVNNPNLPVFESMQQFTLSAITASGNSSMTDAQKLALNHFFYQLGAFENNGSIWNKIKGLSLPVICNDNINTALTNFKILSVKGLEDLTFDNHGITITSNSTLIPSSEAVVSSLNLSMVVAFNHNFTSSDDVSTNRTAGFYVKTGTPLYLKLSTNSSNFIVSAVATTNMAGLFNKNVYTNIDVAGIINSQNFIAKVVNNGEVITTSNYDGTPLVELTYQNNRMYSGGTSYTPLCVSITAEAFTETEMEKVMLAAKVLKDAFVTQSN